MKVVDPQIGAIWLVQRWTQTWDKGSRYSYYKAFFDHFIVRVLRMCGVSLPRLPMEIVKKLRIRSAKARDIEYSEGAFSHNFCDFFFYSNCTITISSRFAFIELMWQLMWMERDQIRTEKKGEHLPRMIVYDKFNVGCDTLEKVQKFIVNTYQLKVSQAINFDPEGYINYARTQKLKVTDFSHHFDEREDIIRNASPLESIQIRKKWEYLNKLERERKVEDPSFQGFLSNIQNDFTKMMCKIRNFDEVIVGERARR